jgi:prepilin-type processing-associated H-X9-DG protein
MQPGRTRSEANDRNARAFTLTELVVIIAVLVVLALCLLPAVARTETDTRAFQCLNNHRPLARAWRLYADDNNDRFCGIIFDMGIRPNDVRSPWVQGWLSWDNRSDNTNTVFLTDSRFASIAAYLGRDSHVFKCPADQFVSPVQRNLGWRQRVRSVAGNGFLGGNVLSTGLGDPAYVSPTKWAELINPKPSETWLFMDEHPDSMNDPVLISPGANSWIDMPANLHDGGAGVAYADGSAEIHGWEGTLLNYPVRYVFTPLLTQPNDPDIAWLRYHTPRKPE